MPCHAATALPQRDVYSDDLPFPSWQVLCSRAISRGELAAARHLLRRLLRRCALLGCLTSLALVALAAPVSQHGQSGRPGEAIAGHHGLVGLHLKALGCS
tara:strand:- start:318 stop:617 length:300 start_codon:yes stop_codon:yes gene_type:complete